MGLTKSNNNFFRLTLLILLLNVHFGFGNRRIYQDSSAITTAGRQPPPNQISSTATNIRKQSPSNQRFSAVPNNGRQPPPNQRSSAVPNNGKQPPPNQRSSAVPNNGKQPPPNQRSSAVTNNGRQQSPNQVSSTAINNRRQPSPNQRPLAATNNGRQQSPNKLSSAATNNGRQQSPNQLSSAATNIRRQPPPNQRSLAATNNRRQPPQNPRSSAPVNRRQPSPNQRSSTPNNRRQQSPKEIYQKSSATRVTNRRPPPSLKELKREVRQTLKTIEMAPEFSEELNNMKYPMDQVKDMLTSTNPFMQNLVDNALSKMDQDITNPMERVQDFLGYMDDGFYNNMDPLNAAKMVQSTDKISDFITRNIEALTELFNALISAGKKILGSFTKLFGDIFAGFSKTLTSLSGAGAPSVPSAPSFPSAPSSPSFPSASSFPSPPSAPSY